MDTVSPRSAHFKALSSNNGLLGGCSNKMSAAWRVEMVGSDISSLRARQAMLERIWGDGGLYASSMDR